MAADFCSTGAIIAMLAVLNDLIEQRISQARDDGQFEQLPGAGRPLDLREDPLVPEEVRVANRVLKNAGFVPPEVAELKTMAGLEKALTECGRRPQADADEQRSLRRRLVALSLTLQSRGVNLHGIVTDRYRQAIIEKLAGDKSTGGSRR